MTLTLLDLYNSAASQEWAMYDNDALSDAEFEESFVLALNKAIIEIFASYEFPFRDRTHLILTLPNVSEYDLPTGLIKRDKKGDYLVKFNSKSLKYIENSDCLKPKCGVPEGFYIKNDNLILYPAPCEKGLVTVDYMTLVIGENVQGEDIYTLKNDTDKLNVPIHLEELMKEAVITRTMLNTIASESDENYSAYKKQADNAYRLLVKYSKSIEREKSVKF